MYKKDADLRFAVQETGERTVPQGFKNLPFRISAKSAGAEEEQQRRERQLTKLKFGFAVQV